MMLCSGGGARCDYEALKYFTEFWCSDNTDPIERLFIQWGFSQIFPSKAMSAHVTSWNKKTSVKFRTDVASMCKLGFDLGLKELNADELTYCQNAVANWTRLKKVILDGDQYRLFLNCVALSHLSVTFASQLSTFKFVVIEMLTFAASLLKFCIRSSVAISKISVILSSALSLHPYRHNDIKRQMRLKQYPEFFMVMFFGLKLILLLILLALFINQVVCEKFLLKSEE